MHIYLLVWNIRRRDIPRALLRMAIDRFWLRKNHEIEFFKSLGTGAGRTFTPRDADSKTWALLITSTQDLDYFVKSVPISSWRRFALSEEVFTLSSLSSHGSWAGRQPFARDEKNSIARWDGEVATITRARISWQHTLRFWRAVPPVTDSLLQNDGLIRAIGIGEAPIGLQGTFSHWKSQEALRAFAYQGDAHKRAIELTAQHQWYREELFARFAVIRHFHKTLRD